MPEDFRFWVRSHSNLVLSFSVGMTFGIGILLLAFFSQRIEIAARSVQYGVAFTGHPDVVEDLIWIFCGIVIGSTVTSLAWWRDAKAQSIDLEKAHVLHRLIADSAPKHPGKPGTSPEGSVPGR